MRTNFSQEVQPIILTEPQIQNDHTGMRLLKMAVQLVSAGCRLGRDILLLQIAGHHLSQRGVIINNNDMADICEHELISQPSQSPTKLWCLRRRTRPRGRCQDNGRGTCRCGPRDPILKAHGCRISGNLKKINRSEPSVSLLALSGLVEGRTAREKRDRDQQGRLVGLFSPGSEVTFSTRSPTLDIGHSYSV